MGSFGISEGNITGRKKKKKNPQNMCLTTSPGEVAQTLKRLPPASEQGLPRGREGTPWVHFLSEPRRTRSLCWVLLWGSPALTTLLVGLRYSGREVAAFVAPPRGELKPRTSTLVQAELSWASDGEEDSLSCEEHSGALGIRSKPLCIPE